MIAGPMTNVSLLIWGTTGIGLTAMLFLLYELKNAPYEDEPEAEQALPEVGKPRLRFLPSATFYG
jgi:hypothetical protein